MKDAKSGGHFDVGTEGNVPWAGGEREGGREQEKARERVLVG